MDEHLPSGNPALDNVSLFSLLSHQSGVGGPTQDDAFGPDWIPGSDAASCVNVSLTRFAMALNTNQSVAGSNLDLMRQKFTDVGLQNDFGLGTMLGDGSSSANDIGQPDYWHGGIIAGHTAAWTYWPGEQQGLSVNLSCNNDINPVNLRTHAQRSGNAIRGSQPTYVPSIQYGPT